MSNCPMRILLVDDDEVTNFLSREMLRMFLIDPAIHAVDNGQDALNYLKESMESDRPLPNLILLDINMPVMDGWEFLREFEQLKWPGLNKVNVVMFTSSVYYEDIDRARSHDCVREIYSKPLDEEKIKAIMQHCVST